MNTSRNTARLFSLTLIVITLMNCDTLPICFSAQPALAAINARSLERVGQSAPKLVANGRIAFVSAAPQDDAAQVLAIYTINPDGSDRTRLTAGPTDFAPAWSPDGAQILFTRSYGGRQGESPERYEIFVMNADGSNQRCLTPAGESDDSPAWSPDGKQLVFVRSVKEGNSVHGQIFTMNVDGSDQRRLTRSDESDSSPVWSPDGENIAFFRISRFGAKLVVIQADGNDEKVVGGIVFSFSWSPDGSKLAVSSYEIGLYTVNADGTGPKSLTYPPVNGAFDVAYDTSPAWSGDGSRIVFSRFLGCNIELVDCKSQQVWVIDADGSNLRQLTEDRSVASAATWSPDGQQILLYDTDLVLIDPDNGEITNITNTNDANESSPSWQPLPARGCVESVSPDDMSFTADGGTGRIEVAAGNECNWTAITHAGWISLTMNAGTGNASIVYSVAANSSTAPRKAALILAGAIVRITQAGLPVRINTVLVERKRLFVFGENFDPGAVILLNGEEQKTRNDGQNPKTGVIGKKAGKKIHPGDKLQVRNPNGTVSEEYVFSGS